MSLFGYDHAIDLLRARLVLTSDGGLQTRVDKDKVETLIQLPGASYYARVVKEDNGNEVAKIYFPSGRGLEAASDITDPENFAKLLHNADCSIKARRAHHHVPTELFSVADRMVALRRKGEIEIPSYPVGDMKVQVRNGVWTPTKNVERMIEGLALDEDPVMSTASRKLIEVRHGRPSAAFDEEASRQRWLDQAGAWLSTSRGVEPEVYENDGYRWSEIANSAAMSAASSRVGKLQGIVAGSGRFMSTEEITDVLRRLLKGDPKQRNWPAQTFFELADGEGRSCGLAIVDQMEIIMVRSDNGLGLTPSDAAKWLRAGLAGGGLDRENEFRAAI